MRALIQRVSEASVSVEDEIVGQIGPGLCVYLGVGHNDTAADAEKLAVKVTTLRVFPDEEGKMNRSLIEISGELLVISQFTLYGDTSRGNRPSYTQAAEPEKAIELTKHSLITAAIAAALWQAAASALICEYVQPTMGQ